MPQLMPMFWDLSLFMMMIIFMLLITMFNYMKSFNLNMKSVEFTVYKIKKW